MSSTLLPLEYLVTSSENCLEGFELARLNQISNLRKEFSQVFDDLVEAEIGARLARWMLDGRRTQSQDIPAAQCSSGRASPREVPASASKPEQLPLPRDRAKPSLRGSPRNSSSSKRTQRRRNTSAGPGRGLARSPEHGSDVGDRSSPISAESSAALQLLETSAACDAHWIGYSARRAGGGAQFATLQRARMLPFPGVHTSEDCQSVAGPAKPASRKVLSLPLTRPRDRQRICEIPEDGAEATRRIASSKENAPNDVQPFPPVRAPLCKPLVYGNVALSRF
jgi:hypothetical protein